MVLSSQDSDAHQRARRLQGWERGKSGAYPRAWYRSTSNGRRAGPAHLKQRPAPTNSQDSHREPPRIKQYIPRIKQYIHDKPVSDARRPPARTYALGLGMGKSGGGHSTLTTCHAPARESPAASRSPPPQSGALFSLLPRNCRSASGIHQTRGPALGTVPARGLWRLCARRNSDAHQSALTL